MRSLSLLLAALLLSSTLRAQDDDPRADRYRAWARAAEEPQLHTMLVELAREDDPTATAESCEEALVELEQAFGDASSRASDEALFLADWSVRFFDRLEYRYEEPPRPEDFPAHQTLPGALAGKRGGRIGLASVLLVVARRARFDLSAALVGLTPFLRAEGNAPYNFDPALRGQDVPDDALVNTYAFTEEGRHGPDSIRKLTDREFVGLVLFERARSRTAAGRDAEARIDLEGTATLFPGLPAVESSLGEAALAAGDRSAALDHFRRAIANGSRSLADYDRTARILSEDGRLDEALEAFRGVLAQSPGETLAWLGSASVHEAKRDWENAVRALDEFLARSADEGRRRDVLLWRGRLVALQQIGRMGPDRPFDERIEALSRLEEAGSPDIVPHLLPFLDDRNFRLRWATAHAIAKIAGADAETARRLGVDRRAWESWWAERSR